MSCPDPAQQQQQHHQVLPGRSLQRRPAACTHKAKAGAIAGMLTSTQHGMEDSHAWMGGYAVMLRRLSFGTTETCLFRYWCSSSWEPPSCKSSTSVRERLACLGEEVCFQADQIALRVVRVQPVQVLVQQQLRGICAEVPGRHAVPAAAGRLCRPCCSERR